MQQLLQRNAGLPLTNDGLLLSVPADRSLDSLLGCKRRGHRRQPVSAARDSEYPL